MLPFHNYQNTTTGFHTEPCLVNILDGGDSILTSSSSKKSTDHACTSHKEAERRRRQRINSHLSTLRTLLPNTAKTDKASLLAEVVRHVKELRNQVNAHVACNDMPFPGELDEASLSFCEGGDKKTMRVSVCCDDRPGLNLDLSKAIRSVKARPVRAEMMTIGGRTRSVVVVQWGGDGGGSEEKNDEGGLRRALRTVVENKVSGCSNGPSQLARGHKRVRDYDLVSDNGNLLV